MRMRLLLLLDEASAIEMLLTGETEDWGDRFNFKYFEMTVRLAQWRG